MASAEIRRVHFKPCNWNQAKHWRNRRSEIIDIGRKRDFEVVTTQDVWMQECNGRLYCPSVRCLECSQQVVTSTSVSKLQQGSSIGCACNWNQAKHWRNRRSEIIEIGRERDFEVVSSQLHLIRAPTNRPPKSHGHEMSGLKNKDGDPQWNERVKDSTRHMFIHVYPVFCQNLQHSVSISVSSFGKRHSRGIALVVPLLLKVRQ